MSKVIGIDLGTSNSCVSIIEKGRPLVVLDSEGRNTTPSVYAESVHGDPIVGYEAKERQHMDKINTIFAAKRLIGRKYKSPEVAQARDVLPYKIISADNGDAWVEMKGKAMSPEQVGAAVLTKMKEIAEEHLGESVEKAVITVPAHFNDSQRQATKDAGRLAGLEVLRIINEPTAAALAYGLNIVDGKDVTKDAGESKKISKKADRIIAVFDLGGGTFDISILQLKDGIFDVIATNGDTFLGGEDFDLAIVDFLLSEFQRLTGRNVGGDKAILQRFKDVAKQAKHDLSKKSKVELELSFVQGLEHMTLTLNRKQLESIVRPIIERIEKPCLDCLEDSKLAPEDISDVILVGGMTRMPAVKKSCFQIFNQVPRDDQDPDETVALGAAVQGGIIEGAVRGVALLDVTSLSLGLEVQGGATHVLVPRNSTIPARITEVFTTSAPNQPQIDIHVVQGEDPFAPHNKSLGLFHLANLRPMPRGVPEIAVTFEVDAEGIINVEARDIDTGETQKVEIEATSGLDEEAMDKLLAERALLEEQERRMNVRNLDDIDSDDDEEDLTKLKTELKGMVFILQSKLNHEGESFRGKPRKVLEKSLDAARFALQSASEIDELEERIGALQRDSQPFCQYIENRI